MHLRSGKHTSPSDSEGLKGMKLERNKIVAKRKELIKTCDICYTETCIAQMFCVDGCSHYYCFGCMEKHVEAKLLQGMGLPKCPHEGCGLDLQVDSCKSFLKPKVFDLLNESLKEATIPVALKLYCPYPRCSALMSKSDVQGWASTEDGATMCRKCCGLFCISCVLAWHPSMTCSSFKRSNPSQLDEAKFKAFAAKNNWKQCSMCNHMVSLHHGCYHITCRCGHEFCYMCGAEWKNKTSTCSFPIWVEHEVIYN